MTTFKPNLIPNNKPGDDPFEIVEKNGVSNYLTLLKKDGCRLETIEGEVLARSMKRPKSLLVQDRFKKLAEACKVEGIILEGEFFSRRMKFNEIFRFFSHEDVTAEREIIKLTKLEEKGLLKEQYGNRSIEWLTTFHKSLKFWWFDGYIQNMPNLGFEDRLLEIKRRLSNYDFREILEDPTTKNVDTVKELRYLYSKAIKENWEGLVLVHKDHVYKMGRSTINQGTLLKLKDDKHEYDGVVLEVEEGTVVKDGVETTINELGYSTTSKLKEDRELSGMAKGLVVQFGEHTFSVGLRGFTNEAKVELLKNKDSYIGRHFKYSGMPPIKDVPRHAFFDCWRDAK